MVPSLGVSFKTLACSAVCFCLLCALAPAYPAGSLQPLQPLPRCVALAGVRLAVPVWSVRAVPSSQSVCLGVDLLGHSYASLLDIVYPSVTGALLLKCVQHCFSWEVLLSRETVVLTSDNDRSPCVCPSGRVSGTH